MRTLVSNRAATHSYTVVDKVESGLILEGWEVKSLKGGRGSVAGAFVIADTNLDLWVRGMHIPEWTSGEPKSEQQKNRLRKLLLHKSQQRKLAGLARQPGYSLIPIEIIENDRGYVKMIVALVKGKKQYERKQDLKDKEAKRQISKFRNRFA